MDSLISFVGGIGRVHYGFEDGLGRLLNLVGGGVVTYGFFVCWKIYNGKLDGVVMTVGLGNGLVVW